MNQINKTNQMNQFHLAILALACAGLLSACSPRQFTTITIYDKPDAYVRLEFDRTVKQGMEHAHPISLRTEQIAAVLGGVRIEEPPALVRGDILLQNPVPRVHPAFTDKDIALFAPLLVQALSKATPEEVVTFYLSKPISAITREVTSGGLFIQGEELRLILANYRSNTRYMADMGVAESQDDRLTPMQSMAPQVGHLSFEPHSAKRERPNGSLESLFYRDQRELRVLYKQLPPHPLVQAVP
jgi:hypothetical protein